MKKEKIELTDRDLSLLAGAISSEIFQEKKQISILKSFGIDCTWNNDRLDDLVALNDKLMDMSIALLKSTGI